MQNAGQFGPGAASAHPPSQFVPSEPSPNGGSTTSSLRQFRKKDVDKNQAEQQHPPKQMSESHVARVAPHNHYPPSSDNLYRYPAHQFSGCSPQVKYSDLAETSQPNPISTSVIQKPKPKDYMEMCNVQQQQQHLNPQYSPENGQYMAKEPVQGYPAGFKSESHFFPKDQHQYHPSKFNSMMGPNIRKFNPAPADNPFLNKLSKLHPSMARSIMSDHHLQDTQPNYPPMDQRGIYAQQNHRYYSGSIHQPNLYSPNSNYTMSTPHLYSNYPSSSCSYPRGSQIGSMAPRYPQMERSLSPGRRGYPEGMHVAHMNYHPMHQKMPNYPPQYRGPEYSQHYQHRRMPQDCFPPQACRTGQYMQGHHQIPGQELSENTVSPSDSLKKFIENWADEEPSVEMEANMNLRDKLRDDAPAGTVYMINATDVQYFENNGIPIVTSDNGGFQLTSENYQYLLKNGIVDNTGMVRIIEANKEISIDSNGNQERVVNLQIMEAPKADCMLANKHLRESMLPKPEEENRRVVIHQNTVLNPPKGVANDRLPQQPQSIVDSLSSTKELVDKNCSPINLDHLEHNLGFSEPELPETENKDQPSSGLNLNEDLSQNSDDSQYKSPESKSMPIIDFFGEPPVIDQEDKENESAIQKQTFSESEAPSPPARSVIVTPEDTRSTKHDSDDRFSPTVESSEPVQPRRKRMFSVDDIIHNIGPNVNKENSIMRNTEIITNFIARETEFSSLEQITSAKKVAIKQESDLETFSEACSGDKDKEITQSSNTNRFPNAFRIEGSSAVLQIDGEFVEIKVNVVNGRKIISVTPLSNTTTVVDYNDNYELTANVREESDALLHDIDDKSSETSEDEACEPDVKLVKQESESTVIEEPLPKSEAVADDVNLSENDSLACSSSPQHDISEAIEEIIGSPSSGVSTSEQDDDFDQDVVEAATPLEECCVNSDIDKERIENIDSESASAEEVSDVRSDEVNAERLKTAPSNESDETKLPQVECELDHDEALPEQVPEKTINDSETKSEVIEENTQSCTTDNELNNSEIAACENVEETLELNKIDDRENIMDNEDLHEETSDMEENKNIVEAFDEPSEAAEEVLIQDSGVIVEVHIDSFESDHAQDSESLNFPLEDEVFIAEPPAHEVVVTDPLEGIGVVEERNDSLEIPLQLEPVTTTEEIVKTTENETPSKSSKPEIQILSPTSTNIEDPVGLPKSNVYFEPRRKYSTDNDLSQYATSTTVTTKAAKKLYDSDLRVQHDIVSSSKKEDIPKTTKSKKFETKRSKRLNEKVQVKNERKEKWKILAEKRKSREELRLKHEQAPKESDRQEQDDEYVDFKELLRARKLKKLKKLQEAKQPDLVDNTKPKQKSDCCLGCSNNVAKKPKISNAEKHTIKSTNKANSATVEIVRTSPQPNKQSLETQTERCKKRVIFSDEFPSSTSKVDNKAVVSSGLHPKDPRRRSKAFEGHVLVPSVSELIEENVGAGSKKKISLADYVSRKRKATCVDEDEKKSDDCNEKQIETKTLSDVKTAFVINSSDWEDSSSPAPAPTTPKEESLIQDFSGLIKNNSKKPVIDVNELTPPRDNPGDKKLQEYKDKVDSQLSSLNIQIPKLKPLVSDSKRLNLGPCGSPDLVARFLNNKKLKEGEMEHIRQIIAYKRLMQHQKNGRSPSKSPSDSANSPDPTYEISNNSRFEEDPKEMRLHLKKVNAKRKLQQLMNDDEDSGSVMLNQNSGNSPSKKNVGYSVINRLGEDGQPKIIFKRNRRSFFTKEPVVELVKLNLDNLEKVKEKYNVTVRHMM